MVRGNRAFPLFNSNSALQPRHAKSETSVLFGNLRRRGDAHATQYIERSNQSSVSLLATCGPAL